MSIYGPDGAGTGDYAKKTKAGDTVTGTLAMSNNRFTGLAGPRAAQDAATKD